MATISKSRLRICVMSVILTNSVSVLFTTITILFWAEEAPAVLMRPRANSNSGLYVLICCILFLFWNATEIWTGVQLWKNAKLGSDADLTLSASEQWRIVLLLSNCVALWPLMIYSTDLICCMIVGSCFIKIFSLITTSLYILELERSMPAVDDEIAEVGFNDVRPCDAA
ncbi:uncharacterized protein LOC110847590 isoform X2 [Folsomia candida]|uniref:uncharacterized protein LOC110847590 isoform X2 n=1 Tax=Folsomia candida TaxID=158441 RepID=UPI000B8FEADA|nr:uncharacterized protein LOC110847590 isoform X2 [Folsomia candida]